MKLTSIAAKLGTLLLASSLCHAAPQVVDSFESANLLAPVTNTIGFKWEATNYTSVVGMVNNQPTRVWSGSVTNDIWTGHDFTCYDGTYCLRFRYSAGQNMSEQRFNASSPQKDIWIRYWIRVPTNYTHGATSPSNHKFFALWMDQYEGNAPLVIWEFWGNGSGGSNIGFHFRPNGGIDGPHLQQVPFVSTADRGKWMQIVIHVKASTSNSSNDGIIQMYRKWNGEGTFKKLHELSNANFSLPSSAPQGWGKGYFMGWTNAPYAAETEWLIDGVTIAAESLLGDSNTTTSSPPTAPALKIQ